MEYEQELRAALGADGAALTVPRAWEGIPGTSFGGFVAAAVLLAAAERSERPRPLSFFARFYRPVPLDEPVELALAPERTGRTVQSFHARLLRAGSLLASFSMAFGREGDALLASQSVPPLVPLARSRPVWKFLEEAGLEVPRMMRRVGFRGPPDGIPARDAAEGWHLRSEWPAARSSDPAIHSAVSLMPIDSSVAAATMNANSIPPGSEWPVVVPSLDLTAWFYSPEVGSAAGEWLSTRTAVPVTRAGYAVGRTQVWAREVLLAEGMSQVALVPRPPAEPA